MEDAEATLSPVSSSNHGARLEARPCAQLVQPLRRRQRHLQIWYAPAVGMVKSDAEELNGFTAFVRLALRTELEPYEVDPASP